MPQSRLCFVRTDAGSGQDRDPSNETIAVKYLPGKYIYLMFAQAKANLNKCLPRLVKGESNHCTMHDAMMP